MTASDVIYGLASIAIGAVIGLVVVVVMKLKKLFGRM